MPDFNFLFINHAVQNRLRPKVGDFASPRNVNDFVDRKDLVFLKWFAGLYKAPFLD